MSDDEGLSISEELIRRAFDQPNASSELLDLIKKCPTYMTIVDILVFYTIIAEENPGRAEELALTLVQLHAAQDAPMIDGSTKLPEVLVQRLAFMHGLGFAIHEDTKIFGSTNVFLVASLLSALSFKYNLVTCSDQFGGILYGLNAKATSREAEVFVTGACIQLLTAGSKIILCSMSYFKTGNEVAAKLQVQKAAGAIKNENVQKLVELTIAHAETGFKKENDLDMNYTWQLLFPPQNLNLDK